MNDILRLVIFQVHNDPFITEVEASRQSEYADWLLKGMEDNRMLVFKEGSGDNMKVQGSIRGGAVTGFLFEPIRRNAPKHHPFDDPELRELQNEQLRLNIQVLKNQSSGDEWKNGGF